MSLSQTTATPQLNNDKHLLELQPYNLTAAQKPIIVQTHLHLITCPPDLESNSFIPSSPNSVHHLKGIHHPYPASHLSADLKRHYTTPVHASHSQIIWLKLYKQG